jgi:hypothetical protein
VMTARWRARVAVLLDAYPQLLAVSVFNKVRVEGYRTEHGSRSGVAVSIKSRRPRPCGSTRRAGRRGAWARGSASALTPCSQSSAGPGHRSGHGAAGHPATRTSSRARVRDPVPFTLAVRDHESERSRASGTSRDRRLGVAPQGWMTRRFVRV